MSSSSLADLLDSMDRAVAEQDPESWAELNIGFHRQIAMISGMPMLMDMTNRVLDRWDRVRRYMRVLPGRMAEANQQHHDIVQALRRRDATAARTLVTRHNLGALSAYQSRLDEDEQAARQVERERAGVRRRQRARPAS